DVLAPDQLGQVAALLILRAPAADLVHAQVRVGAVGKADRGRGAGDFLERDHILQVAQAQAAVVLLHGDAVQARIAHLRPEFAAKGVGAVDRGRAGRDLGGGEAPRRLANGLGGLAEPEIEGGAAHHLMVTTRATRVGPGAAGALDVALALDLVVGA